MSIINHLVMLILEEEHYYRKNLKIGSYVLITLKKDQRTDKLVYGKVKNILTSKPMHTRGIKVRLENDQVGRVQKILSGPIKLMNFPKEEHESLIKDLEENYDIMTSRCLNEYNKYFKGDVVQTDFGYFLEIDNVQKYNKVSEHPYYKYLTKKQIDIIGNNKFDLIRLFKLGRIS